jgi:predicted nucleotidyltransferase
MKHQLTAFQEYHRQRDERKQRQVESYRLQVLGEVRRVVLRLATAEASIEKVGLFGSLVQPGRFRRYSDVDMALLCDNVKAETRFWRALEEALERNVDLRSWKGSAALAVETYGEVVYEREKPAP